MIGLDTNVLVRLVTHDDATQLKAIHRFLEQSPGPYYVSDLVWVELVWVLSAAYNWSRAQVVESLRLLSGRADVIVDNEEQFSSALQAYADGADFADEIALQAAQRKGCTVFASLDRDLCKRHATAVRQIR